MKHYLILRMKKVKKSFCEALFNFKNEKSKKSFDEALFNFKKKIQIMKGKKL